MSNIPVNPGPAPYPASLVIDFPDRKLNRLTSFFRIFMAIPIYLIAILIGGGIYSLGAHMETWRSSLTAGGFLFLPLILMILFRKKYPKWWFDWTLALAKFGYRCTSYIALLRDEYPSTDDEQAIRLNLIYPNAQTELGRGWPLIKWLLAFPHYIILFFLYIAAFFCVIIAWFAILFTGRYPKSLFDFVVGVGRWTLRVESYGMLLITDKYPPFSLSE